MSDYHDWWTMRDLDHAAGLVKGSAFRAFKRLRAGWNEGSDFIVLDHELHGGLGANLYAQNRLYRSSIHPVLLTPEVARRILAELAETRENPQ